MNRIQSNNLAEYAAYSDVSDPLPNIVLKEEEDEDEGVPIAQLFDEELQREVADVYDLD